MTARKLSQFKASLVKARQELLNDLCHTSDDVEKMRILSSGDLADHAFHFYEKQLLIEFSSTEKQLLEDINAALDKISDKTFGICESCQNEIDEKRLKAIPYARLCMNCKSNTKSKPLHHA